MVNETAAAVLQTTQSYLDTIYYIGGGIIILLIGFGIGILVKKLLQRVFQEVGLNKVMAKVGITRNLEKWIGSVVAFVIYLFTILFVLDYFAIRSLALYFIVGAVLILLILTLLVGLKDVIPNFIGWLYLQKQGHIAEGKDVDIKEISGTVEHIGYLETEIRTEKGDVLYVPNSLFLQSKFKVKKG